jgi:xylan 1,4-beta-xylosidase
MNHHTPISLLGGVSGLYARAGTGRQAMRILASWFLAATTGVCAPLTLECDFADPVTMRPQPMRFHWDVYNRISPLRNCNPIDNAEGGICIVRPLGGKSLGGKKLIDEDTCRLEQGRLVYDWAPLKQQIANARAQGRIFQLVLDNPPWAFQVGVDRRGQPEVETYGNPWPPGDPTAWADYIQAALRELVATYGREEVEGWRFGIGREMGTEGHWRAGKEAFFEHYRNTVRAVKAVLPAAKVGSHFLWASSKKSWGPDFVRFCRENKLPYDFVGVSFYPFYNRLDRVDLDSVYRRDIAPIREHPDWNPAADLEIHEFALIVSMGQKGNTYVSAPPAHQASFAVMLQKMMYEHDLQHVFQWGRGPSRAATRETFLPLKGWRYHASTKQGRPEGTGNLVDAVFASEPDGRHFGIVAFSYNAQPAATATEKVAFRVRLPAATGTRVSWRRAFPASDADRLQWGDWSGAITTKGEGAEGSLLALAAELPVFSFMKIEIRIEDSSLAP